MDRIEFYKMSIREFVNHKDLNSLNICLDNLKKEAKELLDCLENLKSQDSEYDELVFNIKKDYDDIKKHILLGESYEQRGADRQD